MRIQIEDKTKEFIISDDFKRNLDFDNRTKDILKYYFIDNFSFAKIGRIIGRTGIRVKLIISNSLRKIKLHLKIKNPEMLIEETLLGTRSKNGLSEYYGYEKIKKIKELNGYPARELLKRRNLGKKSIEEIQNFLKQLGFSLDFCEEKK